MKTERSEVFDRLPVKQAVLRQIVPSVASQMVALAYGLADTYFVGILNDPNQTAAITVATAAFLMLTALSNLFGVGGASFIARSLGTKQPHIARQASSLCFFCALLSSALFGALFFVFRDELIHLCGAEGEVLPHASDYALYTLVLGAVPTVLTNVMANLVRAEGEAARASVGITMGCIINIVLDPIFILPWGFDMGAAGAGAATAISNAVGLMYFLIYVLKNRKKSVVSIAPKELKNSGRHLKEILRIGFPSAIQYALTVVAVSAQMNFVSKYSGKAVAALGITKKLDQLPLFFSIGVANGLLPLIGYNHAAGNHERAEKAFRFGCSLSLGFALICVIAYECFAGSLATIFIDDAETVAYAASFLRRMVLAMPFMSICYPLIVKFQAMGRAKESIIVSLMRKGVVDIPLYFIMDALMPLYGCMLVQPIVDTLSLATALILNRRILAKEKAEKEVE